MHVLGKFKLGEKPNRQEIESIVKAGGARLIDAAEAASADLVIMHPSTPRDQPKACFPLPDVATPAHIVTVSIILQQPQL